MGLRIHTTFAKTEVNHENRGIEFTEAEEVQ